MDGEAEEVITLRVWERKVIVALLSVLSAVFVIWAGVVWNSSQRLVLEAQQIRREMSADRLEQQQYRTLLERRITILEQRQDYMFDLLRRQDAATRN